MPFLSPSHFAYHKNIFALETSMIPPFAQNLRVALQKNRSWSNLNPSAVAATVVSLIGEGLLEGPVWIITPTEKESQIL